MALALRQRFVDRLFGRLTRSAVELEADELHERSLREGAVSVDELVDRAPATVLGELRSVALRPKAQVAALVAELYDGTGMLNLVWLGRRSIAGIEPGRQLRVSGRVTYRRGVPTIFNPYYEIVP